VGVAALLHAKLPAGIRKAGVVLSGGNVDLKMLAGLSEERPSH
jgi:threonine dehydratase